MSYESFFLSATGVTIRRPSTATSALRRLPEGDASIRILRHVPHAKRPDLSRSATALVSPSLSPETFGARIAEAFAFGTPAIVRNAGGSRELADTTGAGIVYETEAELGHAVHELAEHADLRGALRRRARAGYERHHTQARHVDAYLDIVSGIVTLVPRVQRP